MEGLERHGLLSSQMKNVGTLTDRSHETLISALSVLLGIKQNYIGQEEIICSRDYDVKIGGITH